MLWRNAGKFKKFFLKRKKNVERKPTGPERRFHLVQNFLSENDFWDRDKKNQSEIDESNAIKCLNNAQLKITEALNLWSNRAAIEACKENAESNNKFIETLMKYRTITSCTSRVDQVRPTGFALLDTNSNALIKKK